MAKGYDSIHPPIKEAIIDIRVNLPVDIDLPNLVTYHKYIIKQFPRKETKIEEKISFRIKKGEKPTITARGGAPIGYVFKKADNSKIVQIGKDRFTYNMLPPYKGFEEFSKQAEKLWEIYIKVAKPKSVTRIALRYINLIDIPLPLDNFKDYLSTRFEVAEGLPQDVSDFFLRVVIPDTKSSNIAIINEVIDKKRLSDKILPLIFDIDVFRNINNLPLKKVNVWEIIRNLRAYKNLMINKSFTDKAKKLYK